MATQLSLFNQLWRLRRHSYLQRSALSCIRVLFAYELYCFQ